MPRKTTKTTACGPKQNYCGPKKLSLKCNQKGVAGPDPKYFKYTLVILIAIVVLMTIFYIGLVLGQMMAPTLTGAPNTFQAGWDAANQKLQEAGFLTEEQGEILSVNGIVTQINGNSLNLTVDQIVSNPLSEQAPTERMVFVDENTKILKRTEKPFEQVIAEEEAYFESIDGLGEDEETPPAPQSYTEESITLNDLKVGGRVTVNSLEDITYDEEFTASEVILNVSAEEGLEEEEI